MDSYIGYKNRRSSSQLLPRVYLLLQISIMLLLSYISYVALNAFGMSEILIYVTLGLVNFYFLNKVFFKCKNISKRNSFGKGFRS